MALGFLGYSRHGHQISQVYCDACATEKIYPALHETLYKIEGTVIYLCEIHSILARRRPKTPGFEDAMVKAMEEANAAKVARDNVALQSLALKRSRERERLSQSGEQSGRSEDSQDQ
jgi:hypothetical protein